MSKTDHGQGRRWVEVEWGGEVLRLLAEGAVWWGRTRTLLVADTHFGKAGYFRRKGVPVPEGATQSSMGTLGTIARRHSAKHIIVVGDLLHAEGLRNEFVKEALALMLGQMRSVSMVVVRGNHDVSAGDLSRLPNFHYEDELRIGAIVFRHEPSEHPDDYEMAGHVHPVVSLRSEMGTRVRVKCFRVRERQIVLPAFGGFTGGGVVSTRPGDRIFAIHNEEIAEVPTVVRARRAQTRSVEAR